MPTLDNAPRLQNRREFLAACLAGAGTLNLGLPMFGASAAAAKAASPFTQRGYYITFMRMPTYGRAQWRRILDCVREDGGNLLILWMGGGFRSRKFPITWRFNSE